MDMLISLIAVIISQCISQHHVAYLKYKQSLFANHTSIRLGKKYLLPRTIMKSLQKR